MQAELTIIDRSIIENYSGRYTLARTSFQKCSESEM